MYRRFESCHCRFILVCKKLIQLGINDPIPKVRNLCHGCTKRWVTDDSNCHVTCKDYLDLKKYNEEMRERKNLICRSNKYGRKGQI